MMNQEWSLQDTCKCIIWDQTKNLVPIIIKVIQSRSPMRQLTVTQNQLEYLQELVMFAYEMEVPEQKGWDIQTYDNLVDEVMK